MREKIRKNLPHLTATQSSWLNTTTSWMSTFVEFQTSIPSVFLPNLPSPAMSWMYKTNCLKSVMEHKRTDASRDCPKNRPKIWFFPVWHEIGHKGSFYLYALRHLKMIFLKGEAISSLKFSTSSEKSWVQRFGKFHTYHSKLRFLTLCKIIKLNIKN